MARRNEHSYEQIKAMVLQAAEATLVEDGLAALNLRTVAADIGYTVGSVYMVFTNRADLLLHINTRTLDAIAATLSAIPLAEQKKPIDALALAYLEYASQNFNRWRIIFDSPLPLGSKTAEGYQDKLNTLFNPLENQLAQLAPTTTKAQQKRAAWALGCSIHGICIMSLKSPPDPAAIKTTQETLLLMIEHFVQGWLVPSGA